MYSSILPKRARTAYRLSRWKDRIDTRAKSLIDRGYSTGTLRIRLPKWVDFACQFESVDLPIDIEGPEVSAYIEKQSSGSRNVRSALRTALRLFLEPEGESVLRLRSSPAPSTALFKEHVPPYLVFSRQHRGRCQSPWVESLLKAFFKWVDQRGIKALDGVGLVDIRGYLAEQGHLARSSVAGQASILRSFFRYLAMSGLVRPELAKLIESPRRYRLSKPPDLLDQDTITGLLGTIN